MLFRQFKNVIYALLSLCLLESVHATPLNLAQTPLFVGGSDTALLQLILQRDNKLFYEAYPSYQDINGDGVLDIRYKPDEINYSGYFDSNLCYTAVLDSYMKPIAINTDKKCAAGWSGDFLNYLTMTRMDIIRSALYGGKRLIDTPTSTVLRRAFVPMEYHTWGIEYTSLADDQYNISEYSPLDVPTSGTRHLLATNNKDFGDIPYLRVRLNTNQRIHEWVENDWIQGAGLADMDIVVDVEVCNPTYPQSGCMQFPNGEWKPVGLFHEFGADDSVYFSLLTGSYENNMQGGVLRKSMSSFTEEFDADTGQFNGTDGLVKTIDAIQILNNFINDRAEMADCGRINSRPMENGECSAWGNPLAEMMYEGLRYFSGQGSPTAMYYTDGGRDESLGLPAPTWDDPYSDDQPYAVCSSAHQLVISDPSPSFDSDDLPGAYFGSFSGSSLGTLDVGNLADFISANESGLPGMKLIGQVGTTGDGAPSPKLVSSFRNIRGQAPEEPHRQGSYYASSVSYYGHQNDIHPTVDGEQTVSNYTLAIGSPVPTIDVEVQGTTVSFAPFARTVGDHNGPWAHPYARTNAIAGFTIEELTPTSGTYRVAYEDEEQGAENDMDAIATYNYTVSGNQVEMTVESTTAGGNYIQHIGYAVLGTSADGVYLTVRDYDTPIDRDLDYVLDVPPGKTPGNGWNDGAPLPLISTNNFTADAASSAEQLESPLWYAAKWGGFKDLNDDGIAQKSEWDANNDGTPDNFFSVTNPSQMQETLRQVFTQITKKAGGGASIAVTGGALNDGDKIYQSSFVSGQWHGELSAYPISGEGEVGLAPDWSANESIRQKILNDSRQIITFNRDSNQGVAFQWPGNPVNPGVNELSSFQVQELSRHPQTASTDTMGEQRLRYIRGESIANFRDREEPLGDIVHSSPVVVGPPDYPYPDDWGSGPENAYSLFRINKRNRPRVVYVGANDGMLHAFDAGSFNNSTFEWSDGTGEEMFAYIPNQLFSKLPALTDRNYTHAYYVDATPRTGDAFFNGAWRSVLAGGLRGGGQGVFALDITNPDTISESNADQLPLWEFGDVDDADMGYSFASPLIVRMQNNRWAAVFGNGYNSTAADASISTTGESALFIVDLETGALIKKFLTGAGTVSDPNGMSEPTAIDLDFDNVIDYIYAGDLHGNVWGFDVSSSNPGSWSVAGNSARYVANDSAGNRHPITTPIAVGSHPSNEGVMLFFGTGKYLEKTDVDPSGAINRVYGLWDRTPSQASGLGLGNLLQQSITGISAIDIDTDDDGVTDTTLETRQSSQHSIDWNNQKGWFLELHYGAYSGEQVIASPSLREGRIIFSTHIPDGNLCDSGESGWLLALDAVTGAMPANSPFDLDGDNQFSESPVSGVKNIASPLAAPTIAAANIDDVIISSEGEGSEINTITLDAKFKDGRLTWRELEP